VPLCLLAGVEAPGAEDVIVLGAAVSLTGKYAPHGTSTKNGYELAVRRINDKGGVRVRGKPYRLVVRYYDDQSNPARSTVLAEQLIAQDRIKFLLGPYGSGPTRAMLPAVEKHKIPMIQAGSEERDLFAKGYRHVFAVTSTADQYLASAIHLAAEQAEALGSSKEALKIALAMERSALAQDVRAGVLEEVRRHSMMIVIDDQLPPDVDDMSATLRRVKMLRPDVLMISGQEKGALTAVKQMREQKVEVPIVAMTHCTAAQIADRLGEAAEHIFCGDQWHRSLDYKDELFGTAEDFARAFEQTYRYEAPSQAAQSAAAVQVFADAFKRAQNLDPETVRDAIAATELETFYGPIKFDSAGRNMAKPAVLTQIQNGKHVVVAPAHLAKAKPVMPAPQPPPPAE
jgi:branched-chain amino acid transport system substrate-binding protein